MACENHHEFKENGILVEASISRKEKLRKKKRTLYALYVMYFTDPSKNIKPKKDTLKKVKNVDEILKDMSIQNMEFGTFQGRHLYVNKTEYDKYQVGDKVKIYYLKNDCTKIKLKEDVDE
jgi:hypothetical protein